MITITDLYENTELRNFGKESILDFIQSKIKNSKNFEEDILDKIPYKIDEIINGTYRSSRGFYYERLWDMCIKFGVTDLTLPSLNGELQTSHIINENPNKSNIEFQKNCWDGNKLNKNPGGYLLQPVRSGNAGGYSDITFLNRLCDDTGKVIGEELYFISVKYFEDEKEISKYDIGKLCALIREHEKVNRTIKLYIFVNNKVKAIEKFKAQNSSSNILIKYINPGGKYENIYDTFDLHIAFFKLKKLFEQYNYLQTPENIIDFEKTYLKVLKSVFIPRFHQKLCISKINKLIKNGEKNILVGAIPRSGKSFIMAGTILDYVRFNIQENPNKKLKFLMMTPAPNETFEEYKGIFNKYIEFEQLGIDVITHEGKIDSKQVCRNTNNHCVIIISKQKLGWSSSKSEKILEMKDLQDDEEHADDKKIQMIEHNISRLLGENNDINVMFLDEAHFGMSTENAQKIVNALDSSIKNTVKIYVTATYNKPLHTYNVKSNCLLTWDINDIQIMQTIDKSTINDNPIKKQFGSDIYTETLEYFGDKSGLSLIDRFKNEYSNYPKPSLITILWDKDFVDIEKQKIGDTEFGWDMNKLFATNGDSDIFANELQMKEIMRYYFGYPDKNTNYEKQGFYRTRGIIPRIKNICINRCRTLQSKNKTSQLWFLPLGTSKIKNKVKALINLLTESNEFKDIKEQYHFYVAVEIDEKSLRGKTGVTYMNNPKQIKNEIEELEKKIKEGKDGIKADNLIILSGYRLQLGISLRNVDIVTLWNSTSSSDAIFQMLFRSMTEVDAPPCVENEYCSQKKFGFMVDMNPQRSILNVNLFGANISKNTDDEVDKYRQITDLINIDEDVLNDKYGNSESDRTKFAQDLFNKLYESWNINVKNIKQIVNKFSFDMKKLEALKTKLKQIVINENPSPQNQDDNDNIPSGKKKEKTGNKSKKNKNENGEEKEINVIELATEVIVEFISLLNIFTLYLDNGAKCILKDDAGNNSQITIIDDINVLKNNIYKTELKDSFLKVLNGRLTGNKDKPYSETMIDDIFDTLNTSYDKQVMNKIIISQKKEYYTIREPDKLLEYINSQIKPKEKEKKDNGEVFTPIPLVNEMLDKLDENYKKHHKKSIFTEKNLKWFDPAVGIGNFPIIIYQRLMIGLESQIPNEEKRRSWILEHMLYMSEFNPKNVLICKKILCGDTYNLNIHTGDTMEMNTIKDFKLPVDFQGFDVIIGNPPYHGTGRKKPYINFIDDLTSNKLKQNGYMLFITPKLSLIFLLGGDVVQKTIQKMYNILYINASDTIKNKYFKNIGSDFMYFILQNSNYNNTTTVIYDDDTKSEQQLIFNSILNTTTNTKTNSIILNKLMKMNSNEWNRKAARITNNLQDEQSNEYPNKIIYKLKTRSENDEIKWTNKTHPDMNKYKVLYPTLGDRILIDKDKNLFPGSSFVVYIACNSLNECKNIEKLLNSDLIKFLTNIFKTQRNSRDYVMKNLVKPGNFDITINDDEDIYKFFNLNKDEINEIKEALSSVNIKENKESTTASLESEKSGENTVSNEINSTNKIFNPLTKRYVKDTLSNRKKIEKATLKNGGKKTIKKSIKNNMRSTIRRK